MAKCTYCKGTGKVEVGGIRRRCWDCGGLGRTTEQSPVEKKPDVKEADKDGKKGKK